MTGPTSYRLDKAIADAVERDGLPRQALDQLGSGTNHVLFRNSAGLAQSMPAADWIAQHGALPAAPTQAEIDAALLARQQAAQQTASDAAALRQQIITLAQSAVGMRVDQLTALQVRALFAIVLWQEGALAPDMTIRPLAQWADRKV